MGYRVKWRAWSRHVGSPIQLSAVLSNESIKRSDERRCRTTFVESHQTLDLPWNGAFRLRAILRKFYWPSRRRFAKRSPSNRLPGPWTYLGSVAPRDFASSTRKPRSAKTRLSFCAPPKLPPHPLDVIRRPLRLRRRTKRLPLPPRSHPPTGRAGPQGESEVNVRKPWQKWAGDKRVLIGIIAVLIFTIWIVLQWQYY